MYKVALQVMCLMLTGLIGCSSTEQNNSDQLSTLDIEVIQAIQFDEDFNIEATNQLAEEYGDGWFFAQLTDFDMLEQFNTDFSKYGITVKVDDSLFDEHYLIVSGEAPLKSIEYCFDDKTNKTLFHLYGGQISTGVFFVYKSPKLKLDEHTDFH